MKKIILLTLLLAFSLTSIAQIELELFASGLNSPVDIQNMGDDRLFIVEKTGRIKIITLDNPNTSVTFLNISSQVSGGSEQGLLGLAFHPDYENNGYFYVNYTKTNGDTQISRFTVSADPNVADANSELEIYDFDQPFSNHNGGFLAFGPDGYLWIGTGDGGSAEDPGNRAQNLSLPLGKMIRIDVDNPSNGNEYGIPADNPFLDNSSALDEIYAYGLRNPWKYTFDGDELWIADVGQYDIEEINRVNVSEAGLNYGWRCYEGNQPFNTSGCPDQNTLTFPVTQYNHSGGNCSITGGLVYRGTEYPTLVGRYFYADICSGMIGSVGQENDDIDHGNFSGSWASFGEDSNGELYISNIAGSISKVTGQILSTDSFTQNSVQMYPNPADKNLTIEAAGDTINMIQIIDIKGRIVYNSATLNALETTISTQQLPSGLYLVTVQNLEGVKITKKLVVK